MCYFIFDGIPQVDKVAVAEEYYQSLVPRVKRIPGFIEDTFFGSPHAARKALNVAEWKDESAVREWRNESTHLRLQGEARHGVYESYRLRLGLAVEILAQKMIPNNTWPSTIDTTSKKRPKMT